MSKTFNIYCDESTHLKNDGHPYMLLGYVSIAYPQIKMAKEQIKAIKVKYNYEGELKWTNVHDATFPLYNQLVECTINSCIIYLTWRMNIMSFLISKIHVAIRSSIHYKIF